MGYAVTGVWNKNHPETKKFVEELNEIISEIHSKISGGREHLVLKYEPNITADLFRMNCCGHRIGI